MSIPRHLIDGPVPSDGCLTRTTAYASEYKGLAGSIPLIPRDEWKDRAEVMKPLVMSLSTKKNNQGSSLSTAEKNDPNFSNYGESSCVGCANETAFRRAMARSIGAKHTPWFSPMSVYIPCAGGRNSGSSIQCVARRVKEVGLLPQMGEYNAKWNFKHHMSQNNWTVAKQQFRELEGWEETARLFRSDEIYDIDGPEEFATALLNGFAVVYARGGHCICASHLEFDGNEPLAGREESYGEDSDWAPQGYAYDSLRKWSSASYGAVAYRTTQIPGVLIKAA